jgi:ribose/xylose/arabinose/galactoside ABC-type transport system permease subunit
MSRPTLFSKYARQFGTLAGLLGLCIVLWILTPHFLTFSNLLNVAQQTSINAIIAVGLTYVIISGGIDLSVGSLVAFSGVVLACCSARFHFPSQWPGAWPWDWPAAL